MYIVITDNECVISRNLKNLNKKMSTQFVDSNFKQLGFNKVVFCNTENMEFVKDLKIMSAIPMKLLYKKDNTLMYIVIANLVISLVLLLKG